MPLLVCSRWRVAASLAFSIILAFTSQLAHSQTAPDVPEYLALRPTGIPLDKPEIVWAIADFASPTQLDPQDYPDATHFTPRQIAQVLCGTPLPAYLQLLQSRNGLSAAQLEQPLGDKIYMVKFPACLYVWKFPDTNPFNYKVKLGDSYSTIHQKFTGVQGNVASMAEFFNVAPDKIASLLREGAVLKIPYVTGTTILPKAQADAVITAVSAEVGPQSTSSTQPPEGQIVSFIHSGNGTASTPVSPEECGTQIIHPFSALDVEDAFEFAKRRMPGPNARPFRVELMIVDNGFFGAKRSGDNLSFRDPEFSEEFFNTGDWNGNLGPRIVVSGVNSAGTYVYPLNYANNLTPNGALSGHGTHVTGLALGGPDFLDLRNKVFKSAGSAWLQVEELNVGDGSDELLPGAEQQLNNLLNTHDFMIVNMSISYDATNHPEVEQGFSFMDQGAVVKHLYVVAAGNDGSNVKKYYPAALGGEKSPTVITVAALDPDGNLTEFTNRDPKVTDVAAPGCNVASWVDDTTPAVPLSGTSQAAPIVSFEAALIRSLTNATAGKLKSRIVASGDLLKGEKQQQLLSGHVRIDVVKSLYVFDDYIQYRTEPAGTPIKLLGTVLSVGKLTCSDGQGEVNIENMVAYKSDGDRAFGYQSGPGDRIVACPLVIPNPEDVLVLKPTFKVAPGYPPSDNEAQVAIPMQDVDEVVMHMRPGPE